MVQEGHELRQDLLLVRQGALEALHAVLEKSSKVAVEQALDFGVDEGARAEVVLELVEHPESFSKYRNVLEDDRMYRSRWCQAAWSELRTADLRVLEYLHQIVREIVDEY